MSKPAPTATSPRFGSRLGGYEIRKRLGAGGMGEVYRARDTRLERDVALKILPEEYAADPARVRRFEREARAASALTHANIVTVYEVGSAGPVAFIAMELVEGRTLREITAQGRLPLKDALDLACQIASGLAHAHEVGIVHRDLKPENVMVSKEGAAKILDFGLAKRMPFEGDAGSGETTLTHQGSIVGTVSYMSPEQAAGQPVSFRSDQFSFGSILYELVAGSRAFRRKSNVETLAAIINEPPQPIERSSSGVPGPVRWIVERCLAKKPPDRYSSTMDLAQDLKVVRDHLDEISGVSLAPFKASPSRRLRVPALAAAGAILAGLLGVSLGRRSAERPVPEFQRLTFGRGTVWSARFAPDGRTVVYGAAWNGAPIRLFTSRTDGRDASRLDVGDADVVSVSSLGDIAMLLGRPLAPINYWAGTLARVPITGGAPRELTDNVVAADWSPSGKDLAIVRKEGGRQRLEYPPGKVLFETPGWIEALRFSPDGSWLAFLKREADVTVEIVDLTGARRVLSSGWKRASGLAWSPDGREVWFGVNEGGWRTPLYAVTLAGKQRLLLRLPSYIGLQDVSRNGNVLASLAALRITMKGIAPGETAERDLSWHEGSLAKAMTPDGKTLLFDEGSEGYFHTIYVRPMDGSPAKRLAEGRSLAISPDGSRVVANEIGRGSPLVLLPTGAGEARKLACEGHRFEEGAFFPDGERLLLVASDPGHRDRSYVMDLRTSSLRAVTPEGYSCLAISPDGREAACEGGDREGVIYPIEGGPPRPIPGYRVGEDEPILWSADGRSLFVGPRGGPVVKTLGASLSPRVLRIDLTTGKRELWRELTPSDRAGLLGPFYNFAMTPDGASYAYSYMNAPSDLYLITGLR
ncbi:MAG TPA: protein kinase [Thermoanaerobaculia bacterium]|nr:protein kinase [Thermoanaerobaculia bacterium]